VKRWGKSPPRDWQQERHGKPHREQCRIGIPRGQPRGLASAQGIRVGSLRRRSNPASRGMVIQRGQPLGQNPAYRPSAQTCAPLILFDPDPKVRRPRRVIAAPCTCGAGAGGRARPHPQAARVARTRCLRREFFGQDEGQARFCGPAPLGPSASCLSARDDWRASIHRIPLPITAVAMARRGKTLAKVSDSNISKRN